ncbi:MAG: hypothetical protein QXD48_03800 [Candidatus Aenigmatarchaeota archaeon]
MRELNNYVGKNIIVYREHKESCRIIPELYSGILIMKNILFFPSYYIYSNENKIKIKKGDKIYEKIKDDIEFILTY